MTSDPIAAVLDQLAACREQISHLDARENSHHAAITNTITEITSCLAGIRAAVAGNAAVLARVGELDHQVTAILARLGEAPPGGPDGDGYQPGPAPRWWKLTGAERADAAARLRAWVEQVYRPGYGQLADGLGPCWEQHPLCLYVLDILAELWSVLYLRDQRSAAVVSAQAEYQARVLPALAEQLITETARCRRARRHGAASAGSLP